MAEKVIVSKSKLSAIGNAIREKTGESGSLTLDTMASKIADIKGEGADITDATATANDILLGKTAYGKEGKIEGTIETYDGATDVGAERSLKKLLDTTKSCYYLFYKYKGTSVEDLISYNDTENVTDMSYMFNTCKSLQTIPLLDTGNVTNMTNMFNSCDKLQTIPQLDTSNVKNMGSMFYNCYKLQTIPQLDTSNVTNMGSMFYNCYNLQTIDITSLDKISSTNNMHYFAAYCYSLTKFIIRTMTVIPTLNSSAFTNCYHFTGTVNATYNPDGLKDGRIYIPDDYVDQLKQATNWSAYADIIVPLSTLEE
jgi:surface protein